MCRATTVALALAAGFGINAGRAQTNYYQGLLNFTMGDAVMDLDANAHLVISGIGPSGDDGVQIATGDGKGAALNLGVYNPDLLPPDAALRWAAIGTPLFPPGPTNQTLQSLTVQSVAGGGGAIFADFTGLGAPTVSVALYSNDTLVAFADGIPPTTAVATFTTAGTPHGGGLPMSINPCILNPWDCYGNVNLVLTIPDPAAPIGSLISLPGQSPMYCTRMEVNPGTALTFLPKYKVKATTVTGQNLDMITVEREGYVSGTMQHELGHNMSLEHHAIGEAQFDLSTPGVLNVSNLGPTGTNGVDVELRNANTYGADMVALNPQPLPPSPVVQLIGAQGTLIGGVGEQGLGMLRVAQQDTNWLLSANLLPAGSSAVRVDLYQECSLVSSYTVDNGSLVLTYSQGASGLSVGYDDPDGPWCGTPFGPLPPWWWKVKWGSPVEVTTPSDQVFTVDRIRLSPLSSASGLQQLTHVSFQSVGPAPIAFVGETARRLGLNFDGNQHFPIGQATLGITATGLLNLGSIGPLQTEGMEMPITWADWFAVAPLPPHIIQLLSYEFHAVLDDVPDRVAATVTLTGTDTGETQFTADMSPLGATHYTVMALNGGTQVASVTNQPLPTFSATTNCAAQIPFLRCDIRHPKCFVRIRLPKLPGDPGPVIRIGPGLAVIGDEVVVMPEDAARCAGPQNRLLITGSGADSFQFTREELGKFGHAHTGLGGAALFADTEMLTVDYVGPSGNNGVSIDLSGSLNALASFAPLDFSAVQHPGHPGPWIQADIVGGLGGLLNQDLGSLRFTSVIGGGAQIDADFSSIGSGSHTIEIWNGSQLVQQIPGATGTIGTVDDWPTGLGEQSTGSPTSTPGCTAAFGQVVHISVMGQTYEGDGIRVYPENPSQPVGALQALHLLGSGFDAFTILNETTTPAITPAITAIAPAPGGNVVLSIPTVFGYDYTLEAVSVFGLPHPFPWAPVTSFLGDGSVQQITVPAVQDQQFFRVSVQGNGM